MSSRTDHNASRDEVRKTLMHLCKGVVYRTEHEHIWHILVRNRNTISTHLEMFGLSCHIDDAEGYAFCQNMAESESGEPLPRLVARRELPYHVSVLVVLLRQRLAEHDTAHVDTRLVMSTAELVTMLALYQESAANEARRVDTDIATINKVRDLGFLRKLPGDNDLWEVRRIIKAVVDAQSLASFEARLAEYRAVVDVTEPVEVSHD